MINQTQQMVYRLGNLDLQQEKISYQMSTGKLLQKGSDDSMLYSREISLDDKVRTFEGLQTQIEKTTLQNNVADASMSQIKKILEYVKAELIKGNTATTTEEGLKAIASNLQGMKQNLYDLANTQVEGEYVFSGSDSSVKPFSQDADGNVSYDGNNKLRKIAVEEGSYRDRGINGFDMMMYPSSTAFKNQELTFKADDRIVDQDGSEWKLDNTTDPLNPILTKYDINGNVSSPAQIQAVTANGTIPETYKFTTPSTEGTKFEAKSNIFNLIDNTVNALKKVDNNGDPITVAQSKALISKGLDEVGRAFDGVNIAHADLGGKNRVFEVSLERVTSKLTQFNILSQKVGAADITKVAMEAKALELTYTALYSTINKTNQLSLVNFMN